MRRGLFPLLVGLLAALAVVVIPSVAVAATAPPSPIVGGATQDTFSYPNAIRQTVWVDTGLTASGQPGGHVRVAADIIRPSELDGVAKVPVIMEASPYYSCCGRGNELQVKQYDAARRADRISRCSSTTTSCRAATPSCWSIWPAPTGRRAASTSVGPRTSRRRSR